MLYVAWVLSLIAVFTLGYHFRSLAKKIETLEEVVKSKVDKPPEPEEPKSQLIDPSDPIQNAIYEHKRMMEGLNDE